MVKNVKLSIEPNIHFNLLENGATDTASWGTSRTVAVSFVEMISGDWGIRLTAFNFPLIFFLTINKIVQLENYFL